MRQKEQRAWEADAGPKRGRTQEKGEQNQEMGEFSLWREEMGVGGLHEFENREGKTRPTAED